jgi:hypothetical protein
MRNKYWLLLISLIVINMAAAFEINSSTYSADRYIEGISGSIGDSYSYSLRQTGQYQGTSPNAESSTYEANIGVYDQKLSDTQAPLITLISPINNTTWTNSSLILIYNISDDSNINYCALLINGIIVINDTTISQGENMFIRTMSNGAYTWAVSCQDEYYQTNTTNVYDIIISYQIGSGSGYSQATPITKTEIPRAAEIVTTMPKVVIPVSPAIKYLFLCLVLYTAWLLFIFKRDKDEKNKKRPGDLIMR